MIVLLVIGGFLFTFLKISSLNERILALSLKVDGSTSALAQNIYHLRSETGGLSKTLTDTKKEIATANNDLNAVKNQVGGVEQTVGSISGTVSTLKKLAAIDPELLKKYSKVYFLNENYTPAHVTPIPQRYVYSNSVQESYLAESWPFLERLLDSAKANNVELYISSAYRSFAKQQMIKSDYVVTYGAGTANSFSADQGYSEHQLGTAIDVITTGLGGQLSQAFDKTAAYKWLENNAYQFGFVLSYPKTNTYYIYEPWHWRFVGVKLATYLHNNAKSFYDMDQRDIDTYLVNLFD